MKDLSDKATKNRNLGNQIFKANIGLIFHKKDFFQDSQKTAWPT